jgi:hypothetical protein
MATTHVTPVQAAITANAAILVVIVECAAQNSQKK